MAPGVAPELRVALAVLAPGVAVGGFDGLGEGFAVEEGGGFHAVAEGAAEFGEAGGILGEGDGELDEFLGGFADELGEAEVVGLGPCAAAPLGGADVGGDGDAHIEGVHGGGVAVVREGIEAEVDLVVELVVVDGGGAGDEGDAVGGDTVFAEAGDGAVAVAAFGGEEEEAGFFEDAHDLGPELVGFLVEFAEVVEVAEGDAAGFAGGEAIDGDVGGGVVAPPGVGEVEDGFGGGEGGILGRFEPGVGEAVVDGGDAGGVGVAGVADLDGGGLAGVDEEAVAAHVLVEVDEDVDFVGADGVGDGFIGAFVDVAPDVGALAMAEGVEVGLGDVGVAEDFEAGLVVVFEEGGEVEAEGVLAEFGGEVADAEAAFGVAVIVEGEDGALEGADEGFVVLAEFLEDGVVGKGGVVVHGVDEVAEEDGGELEVEGLAVLGEGVVEAALVLVDVAEVVVEVAGFEFAGEDAFVVFDGFVGEAGFAEAFAAVDLDVGEIGEEGGGLAGGFDGLFEVAGGAEDVAGEVEGLDVGGVEVEGLAAFVEGGVSLAEGLEGGAEAGVEVGGFGGAGDGGAEDPGGFLEAFEVDEDDAEVALGLDVAGGEAEGLLKGLGGFLEAALEAEDDALVDVGFGVIGAFGEGVLVDEEGVVVAFLVLEDDAEGEVEGGFGPEGDGLADLDFGEVGLFGLEVAGAEEVEGVGLIGVGGEDLAEDGFGFGELVGPLVLEGELDGLIDG
jgi:hypothetical protein